MMRTLFKSRSAGLWAVCALGKPLLLKAGHIATGFTQAALVSKVNRAFEERGVTPILETLGPRLTSLTAPPKLQRVPQLLKVVVIATHGLHATFPQLKGELV